MGRTIPGRGGTMALLALLAAAALPGQEGRPRPLRSLLDAPLLFVKRHSFKGLHIYDTFYKWGPGGGIYVLENPADPPDRHRVRPVIDPSTPETLGEGIYSHPDLSWDATRLLFCFKGEAQGSTSIYEIGLDGRGLRRLSDPRPAGAAYKGVHAGVHDVAPAWLPDGRILFTSTRPQGLVPCANEGVNILHVMNGDGSGVRALSVNSVNEFDPCVLPDGRILYGRWEYVDKTALTQQSLWTVFPDGSNETALFANNMVFPEAVLDARPVPGEPHLVAATLAPHNSPPRGSIAFIDTRRGKNNPDALTNLEHPENPVFDRGDSCEPWPLSADAVVFSGRPKGASRNALEIIHRDGRREILHADPNICCHSPMLIQPRPRPPILPEAARPGLPSGRFVVQNVAAGLDGVRPGEVKWLRVIEETSRVSPSPGGAFNQTFLVSAVLAWSAKNVLGVVPVEADGSAFFEAPSGRALYFQALDAEGRLVQSMRTFVQASPGVTRACVGCHEHKESTTPPGAAPAALGRAPSTLRPESWGSGYLDYPSRVQPVLDRRCTACHGGDQGIAAGIDLTGGWTEHFSISYETLTSRRETQLTAYWIAGIDTMNGTSHASARILPPRGHGSGAAPLAALLLEGHGGRLPGLTRAERDLLLAWIDSNGLYHGSWDYTPNGPQTRGWDRLRKELADSMRDAGCLRCHEAKAFENDWINLERPELSRMLRAPLAEGAAGGGLGWCRDRKARDVRRLRMLADGVYHHGVLPLERFPRTAPSPRDLSGLSAPSFASTDDPRYRSLLALIRRGREESLASPRQDMPGAERIAGACRMLVPPPAPARAPELHARAAEDGAVELSWERSADAIGLDFEISRSTEDGDGPPAVLATTTIERITDPEVPAGRWRYALTVVGADGKRSAPSCVRLSVPGTAPPPAPDALIALGRPGAVVLLWTAPRPEGLRYEVARATDEPGRFSGLHAEPLRSCTFEDTRTAPGVERTYRVRALDRRGRRSPWSAVASAAALPAPARNR